MPVLSKLSLAFVTVTLSFSSLVAGCATDAGDDDADDAEEVSAEEAWHAAASVMPGTFKLYAQPGAKPHEGCDVHTVLELANRGGARATLREQVGGLCKLFVAPNERAYKLRLDGTSCGSKIYKGTKRVDGRWRRVVITDHRTRMCRDLVPAKIIVEETDGRGGTRTKYSYDAPPPAPAVGTWLTIAPKQCGTNPWQNGQMTQDEGAQVTSYFASKGIELEAVGFAYPSEPRIVCMACSCPRGDTLVVKAKAASDAKKLLADHGFVEAKGALTTSPTQCGTNPWENGQQTQDSRVEVERLSTWAAKNGAELTEAGFLDYTEPRMVCMACNCPRGDVAIAFPKDAAAATKLESLGFARVAN